jgi:hypothetical protein
MNERSSQEPCRGQKPFEAAVDESRSPVETGMGDDRIALSALLREVLEDMWKEPDFVAYCRGSEQEPSSLESAA